MWISSPANVGSRTSLVWVRSLLLPVTVRLLRLIEIALLLVTEYIPGASTHVGTCVMF